jgi:hypothetical protein
LCCTQCLHPLFPLTGPNFIELCWCLEQLRPHYFAPMSSDPNVSTAELARRASPYLQQVKRLVFNHRNVDATSVKHTATGRELTTFSALLMIASFFASQNTDKTDARMFGRANSGRTSGKGKADLMVGGRQYISLLDNCDGVVLVCVCMRICVRVVSQHVV